MAREFLAPDFREIVSRDDESDTLQDPRNLLKILVETRESVE
jgi:hypothetical protein